MLLLARHRMIMADVGKEPKAIADFPARRALSEENIRPPSNLTPISGERHGDQLSLPRYPEPVGSIAREAIPSANSFIEFASSFQS